MLRVVYEATTDLEPDRLVDVTETRGRVNIKLRHGATADQYIPPLNEELTAFVGKCGWFQIWRGQIISAGSPESPLTVQYEADASVDPAQGVQIRELKGVVRLHVCPDLKAEDIVRSLNPAIEQFLAGGQWFQLWDGEIVTMESPDNAMV
jgi:hypothetical protein